MSLGLEVNALKDEYDDIIYDRNLFNPPERNLMLIRKSREEVSGMESRVIKCPICGFRCVIGYERTAVHIQFRCNKCKFEAPMNLAYFRTQKGKSYYMGKQTI